MAQHFLSLSFGNPRLMGGMKTAEQIVIGEAREMQRPALTGVEALRSHWPEYLMEGALLGTFMISACAFTVLLQHPASPARQAIDNAVLRRLLAGIAMGLTAVCLIYSPWGKQSGAHFNPSTTLTFFRLGKIAGWDAIFYVASQFAGGVLGVMIAAGIFGSLLRHNTVQYAATLPGPQGARIAFVAELGISFLLMTTVLNFSNSAKLARFTGFAAAALVASYISLEAPLSGMSMNPARSFASAFPARLFNGLWIYFTAPPLGMLLAAELYLRLRGAHRIFCAKLHHDNDKRCIFHCNFQAVRNQNSTLKEVL